MVSGAALWGVVFGEGQCMAASGQVAVALQVGTKVASCRWCCRCLLQHGYMGQQHRHTSANRWCEPLAGDSGVCVYPMTLLHELMWRWHTCQEDGPRGCACTNRWGTCVLSALVGAATLLLAGVGWGGERSAASSSGGPCMLVQSCSRCSSSCPPRRWVCCGCWLFVVTLRHCHGVACC